MGAAGNGRSKGSPEEVNNKEFQVVQRMI